MEAPPLEKLLEPEKLPPEKLGLEKLLAPAIPPPDTLLLEKPPAALEALLG
jgi:hypothetical protein